MVAAPGNAPRRLWGIASEYGRWSAKVADTTVLTSVLLLTLGLWRVENSHNGPIVKRTSNDLA